MNKWTGEAAGGQWGVREAYREGWRVVARPSRARHLPSKLRIGYSQPLGVPPSPSTAALCLCLLPLYPRSLLMTSHVSFLRLL